MLCTTASCASHFGACHCSTFHPSRGSKKPKFSVRVCWELQWAQLQLVLPPLHSWSASWPGLLRNQISPFLVVLGIVNSMKWSMVHWSIYRFRDRNLLLFKFWKWILWWLLATFLPSQYLIFWLNKVQVLFIQQSLFTTRSSEGECQWRNFSPLSNISWKQGELWDTPAGAFMEYYYPFEFLSKRLPVLTFQVSTTEALKNQDSWLITGLHLSVSNSDFFFQGGHTCPENKKIHFVLNLLSK